MLKSKIKKGDLVVVTAGKDKGRQGQILAVTIKKNRRVPSLQVMVEGANLIKKHTKGNPSKEQAAGIFEKEAPIDISNVAILNRETGKADRIKFRSLEDGRKIRVYKSTGEVVDT
jgi:large subunit ribosomal protein L24